MAVISGGGADMGKTRLLINALFGRDAPSLSKWRNPIRSSLFERGNGAYWAAGCG